MQAAISMDPSPLFHYTRFCLRNNYTGIFTVTKIVGLHIIIDTNMDIYDTSIIMACQSSEIPVEVHIEQYR